jgi:uncharacterized protein with HEPN domain
MRPDEQDQARLWDMLTYAVGIADTLKGVTFIALEQDKNLRLATERRIEIIGEAARNVSREFQEAHPEIPWQKIVAMRHVLAHEYGEIKHEIIYRITATHIPDLIEKLNLLVPPT